MRLLKAAGLSILVLFFCDDQIGGQVGPDAKDEAKLLSGIWRVDVFQAGENRERWSEDRESNSDLLASRWRFDLTKAEWVQLAKYFERPYATYRLNQKANPKTIDLTIPAFGGHSLKGIYSVDAKEIKLCVAAKPIPNTRGGLAPVETRPTDFTTKDQPDRILLVFARVEAKDK